MEVSLSGSSFKTFARTITCLARIGTELVLHASPHKLELRTLNTSRSAYEVATFSSDFFDAFTIQPASPIQCSVLLKSLLAVLRTSPAAVDRLSFALASPDASKLESTLHCLNGVKKTYWITCNEEPEIQQLSLDKQRFPSSLIVRPRDLTRLLANFQSSLQEITLIATDPSVLPSHAEVEIERKAIELRSYIDPTKDGSDTTLHTQLWIDPTEEFVQYNHVGDPVDITFSVKELKAFLTFCEGCELDIHLYFEKAGEPILMTPKFGLGDGTSSDFDATLVLATMLVSQLVYGNTSQPQPVRPVSETKRARAANASGVSDHTKLWSELPGSAAMSLDGTRVREVHKENPRSGLPNDMERHNIVNVPAEVVEDVAPDVLSSGMSSDTYDKFSVCRFFYQKVVVLTARYRRQPMEIDSRDEPQDMAEVNGNVNTQHHPSNWVDAGDDEDDEEELYVQSTPQFYD